MSEPEPTDSSVQAVVDHLLGSDDHSGDPQAIDRPWVRAALGLGSNLGERLVRLQAAIDLIAADPQVRPISVSPVVETDPVGGPDQPDYLNAVFVIETQLPALELLALAHLAEFEAGRQRTVRWGPRTLDVDVLAFADTVSEDPFLTLPHPRALQRAFVLVPWAHVDPHFAISSAGDLLVTVADALTALPAQDLAGVREPKSLFLTVPNGHTLVT